MEIQLLGPVELWVDGRQVGLGPPQQRTVAAALALEAGRVVPVDRLVALVWPGEPPPSARNALQALVSRLRRLLAGTEARLLTRPPGYLLGVDPATVDAHRFRALVGAARAEPDDLRAAEAFRQALALWRGPALADLPPEPRERLGPALEEARWSALEDRLAVDLRLWRHRELLPELAELVRQQPGRERLVAAQVTALALAGRPAEALDAYDRFRRHLAAEHGTDPGPELRRLHLAVVRGEPLTASPERVEPDWPAPAQLPPAPTAFVGRAAELAAMEAVRTTADREDRAGTAVLTSVEGAGGIGKTALAVHWAHRARRHYPDGQLYVDLRGFGLDGPLAADEALARLLRALGVEPNAVPPGEEERAALFRSRTAGRRLLVLLDNARSSDHVRPLLTGSAGCLTVVTSRRRLDGLSVRDGAAAVRLDVVSAAVARELLARVAGGSRLAAEVAATDQLVELCDGLPLALRLAAVRLAGAPELSVAALAAELADDRRRLDALAVEEGDTTVRAVLAGSLRALPPDAAGMFRLLGLLPGPDVEPRAAAALAGIPAERAAALLDRLAADHLLEPAGGGRFGMHDVVRLYARELAAGEDAGAALTRLFDWYADATDRAERVLFPEREEPPPPVSVPEPVSFDTAAQAVDWLERERANLVAAVRRAQERGAWDAAWYVAHNLTTFLRRGSYLADLVDCQLVATDAARARGSAENEASAANALGIAYSQLRRTEEAVAWYGRARVLHEGQGDRRQAAAVAMNLGSMHLTGERPAEAEPVLRQALALARASGHRMAEGLCLGNLGLAERDQGRFAEAEAHLAESARVLREVGYTEGLANVEEDVAGLYARTGRPVDAAAAFRRSIELAQQVGERPVEMRSRRGLAAALRQLGADQEARHHLDVALAIAVQIGSPLLPALERERAELGGSPVLTSQHLG